MRFRRVNHQRVSAVIQAEQRRTHTLLSIHVTHFGTVEHFSVFERARDGVQRIRTRFESCGLDKSVDFACCCQLNP